MDERADSDLSRLLFQLEMDLGFWFALVVGDDPDDRAPLRHKARAWCTEHAVPFHERFVDLASPRDLAVELVRSASVGVHWVRARDEALPLNTLDGMLVQLLVAMNERRDAYRRNLRGPVVLEGPARLRRSLREMAPDLFSIASFIAEGSGPEPNSRGIAFFDEVERVDRIRRSIREDRSRVSVIRGSGTFDRYLIAVPEDRRRALEVLAAHSTTPTLGELDEFVARVVVPQREQHRWILATVVYQGRQPDAATLAHAQELDVELESFKTFRRLVDFSRYQSKLRAELSNENDLRYAPRRYVAQRLTWALGRDSQSREDALAEMLDQVSVPEGRLLLILGDFGTGKTFLMRQLALRLSERDGPIPLLVNLRLLNKTHDLDVLLAQHLAQQGERNINLDALHYMMDAGDVVLLFDGFDELALRVTFDRAAEHLATLTSAVRGTCRVVVTSRTQHFRNADQSRTVLAQKLGMVNHQVFNLERFDERRIRLFLRDHLAHPRRNDVAPATEDQLDAEVDRRYALLRDIKDLGGLAETPRMLGMILEIPVADLQAVKDRAGTITAAELYQSLLTRWLTYEWERSNPVGEAPGLPVEARWRFVTRFAKRLWLQTDAGLPEEAVADEVTTVVREMKLKIDPAIATHEAASSTLLSRGAEERYAFLHQSVLEYLVAREAVGVVKTPGEVGLLDEGELSVLMARFLIEQAGAEVIVRWAESVPAGAERARANATRLQTMVADEFITVLDLHGQDLRGQDLSALKTKLARAQLSGCDLSGMSLRGFVLRGADLSAARLRGVDLTGADLTGADLTGADLTGAKLTGGDVTDARFERTTLRRASFVETKGATEAPEQPGGNGTLIAPTRITPVVGGAGEVKSLAFDPRGEFLAVAVGNVVWVIEVETYAVLLVLIRHTDIVTSVAFSPEGTRLATGSADKTARVWDMETGTVLAALQEHTREVTSVAFSPDGTRLATGSADTTARVWDVDTGASIATLQGHTAPITSVAFSPDGTRLATASDDHTARAWDMVMGTSIATFQEHTAPVTSVAFSPSGTRLATGSWDNAARVWDVVKGTSIATFHGHNRQVTSVAFSPDGTRLATGSADKTARVWDVAMGTSIATLQGHADPVTSVAFSPEGTCLATASRDHTVRLWDVVMGASLAALQEHTDSVTNVAFSPSGTRLATGSWDNVARVWDVVMGTSIAILQGHTRAVTSVAFSPDGTRLATGSGDTTARVWDMETGAVLAVLQEHTRAVTSVAFSSKGTRLATGSSDKTVRVWDVDTGTSLFIFQKHTREVTSVAFSPKGPHLATGSGDTTARLWDMDAGSSLITFQGHTREVTSVTFSPDGTRLATGSWDNTARVWDVNTGTTLAALQGHTHTVTSVAFSPDGRLLATSSHDGTVRIWNVDRAECLATLYAVGDAWVAFTPTGRYRMAGDLRGSFWHVVGLCRFEPGELDAYCDLRLRDDEPLTPAVTRTTTPRPPAPEVPRPSPPHTDTPTAPLAPVAWWPDVAAAGGTCAGVFALASWVLSATATTAVISAAVGVGVGVATGVARRYAARTRVR